ncbi:MAG TPA: GDP-mannose 4,6-dehydratase [Rhodanobacteraceae bacterium]|jgi:GDPmannose 4,6-dehydratase|nr:GDP-mannose 4,6-dehydratase [Rhodanobacteraceae bacterium]
MSAPLRRALITGIGGQDGALLATQLLGAGVAVIGTHRPGADEGDGFWRLRGLGVVDHPALALRALDPLDAQACRVLVGEIVPDAIFHLAGQSSVAASFRDPVGSIEVNGLGTVHMLEAMRANAPKAHFLLASSAEIFGAPEQAPQNESTPLAATSPYGLSKLLAHGAITSWRASFGLRASSAILFNHESEWRDPSFVTRKLSIGAARIALGREESITLGNLDACRDFGYAPDYVAAMAAMATREEGSDYVLATGHASSIRDFACTAFAAAGITLDWFGDGYDEAGVERGSDRVRVRIDRDLFRPSDAPLLVGDASRARKDLGFAPSLDAAGLARRMVEADLARERALASGTR